MKKYELTTNTKMHLGRKLFQIKALVSFGGVEKGDLGGYIEKEDNLEHSGNAWVSGDALVYGNASVYGAARVSGNALVYGNARVSGNASVYGNALVNNASDCICFKGFGSCCRTTTMFRTKNGDILVKCGCFEGNLEEFEAKVKETHGSSKYAKEYLACAEAAKIHFEIGENYDK
nr:MAG TPA: Putative transferase, nesg, ydcK, Structural Genomics.38A [Caudoviricetes sp.]